MEKERDSVLSTAKDAIIDTAKAGFDVAAIGLEATKDTAVTVAKAGAGVAVTGLEVTKNAAVSAGTAVGDALSSLAGNATRAVHRKPKVKWSD